MTFKSEYRRMMTTRFYRLTIFEFVWMYVTMLVWVLWYQLDTEYFDAKQKKKRR